MASVYASDDAAMDGIQKFIDAFYRTTYPTIYLSRKDAVNAAVRATQQTYGKNIFPLMKTRWSDYPNNIGHFIFPGCMRCHDGKHTGKGGASIPHDCRTCHIILEEGNTGPVETLNLDRGLDFQHPADIASAWKDTGCWQCHSGAQP